MGAGRLGGVGEPHRRHRAGRTESSWVSSLSGTGLEPDDEVEQAVRTTVLASVLV